MIQGIGTILASLINFFAEKACKTEDKDSHDLNNVPRMATVHFIFAMVGLWGSFFILLCMKLDQQESAAEPMLSNAIDTDKKEEEKVEPNVIVIKNKYDLEKENYKKLPLEKKIMDLITEKKNYFYMIVIGVLFTGINYSYFLNQWFNRILTGKDFSGLGLRNDLLMQAGSKVNIFVKENSDAMRMYAEPVVALAQIGFGYLADNFPKRYQIMFAYACSCAATVLLFWVEKHNLMHLLSFIFSSVGYGAMTAILIRLMMDKYLVKNIMDSASILGVCFYVSNFIFGYLTLWIIAYFSSVNKLVVVVIGCAIIVFIILVLFVKEPLITSAHYFDANFSDINEEGNGSYKNPTIEDAGQLFEDKGEGMNQMDSKDKNEEKETTKGRFEDEEKVDKEKAKGRFADEEKDDDKEKEKAKGRFADEEKDDDDKEKKGRFKDEIDDDDKEKKGRFKDEDSDDEDKANKRFKDEE